MDGKCYAFPPATSPPTRPPTKNGDAQSHLHIPEVCSGLRPNTVALRFRSDRFRRTNICARTAVDARRRVDNVNIAGRNSPYRAFVDTRTASDAFVGIDFVSHECMKLFGFGQTNVRLFPRIVKFIPASPDSPPEPVPAATECAERPYRPPRRASAAAYKTTAWQAIRFPPPRKRR